MPNVLEARGLSKRYPGVQALDSVHLNLRSGEIHALCGENGAGKSTLIKILGGILPHGAYEGSLHLLGEEGRWRGSKDALAAGIRIIHQELALAGDLTVAENVFLGREIRRRGFLDVERMRAETARQLQALGQGGIDPEAPVDSLSVGHRQMVEIARALLPVGPDGGEGRVLILDEPTSALSARETSALLDLLRQLRSRGLALLYVSHKLEEVFALADRVTVLRNGRTVGTLGRAEASVESVIPLMVGRRLDEVFPPRERPPERAGAPLLAVKGWTLPSPGNSKVNLLEDVSLEVHAGEIVGIAGLLGAGRTELVESLFGIRPGGRGEVRIGGEAYRPTHPRAALGKGLALVPEDRRLHGLTVEKNIRENITMACLEAFCHGWSGRQIIAEDREIRQAAASMAELGVKAPDGEFPAAQLSGGNQQKVVLAKWLLTEPRLLFLDDPTRGVDVGAKAEIYRLIQDLARRGLGVVLISSENEEVLSLSHRILVLRQGRLVAEFTGGETDPETVLSLCAGGVAA